MPPEPLEQAVEAVESLQHGEFLRMHHRREPCLLYPILRERGFAQFTHSLQDGSVEILICHQQDEAVQAHLCSLHQSVQ